jgi:hypothetical protein
LPTGYRSLVPLPCVEWKSAEDAEVFLPISNKKFSKRKKYIWGVSTSASSALFHRCSLAGWLRGAEVPFATSAPCEVSFPSFFRMVRF